MVKIKKNNFINAKNILKSLKLLILPPYKQHTLKLCSLLFSDVRNQKSN